MNTIIAFTWRHGVICLHIHVYTTLLDSPIPAHFYICECVYMYVFMYCVLVLYVFVNKPLHYVVVHVWFF